MEELFILVHAYTCSSQSEIHFTDWRDDLKCLQYQCGGMDYLVTSSLINLSNTAVGMVCLSSGVTLSDQENLGPTLSVKSSNSSMPKVCLYNC